MPDPPGSFVDADGHLLHVHCMGAGDSRVLLESGVAASSLSWTLVQPAIAEFARVCSYDRAGLGWSGAASSLRGVQGILSDLERVLAGAGAGPPAILVGHSFGSLIVRAYAARLPERVAGLVLVDPPTAWLVPGPERTRLLRGARHLSGVGSFLARIGVVGVCLDLLARGRTDGPRRVARLFGPTVARTLERLIGEVRKLPPSLYPVLQWHWSQPKSFRAMGDYLHVLEQEGAAMASLSPPAHLPVVVISSAHQTADELAAHRRLAGASANGRHLVASGSGHWIPFDEPGVIVSAVRSLVDSASP
jgi:pimeloyl-ACP methyl ester carboxylesterase